MNRVFRWFGIGIPEDATPEQRMRRRVMLLAWPAMLQGLFMTSIQVVDTYLVSRLGEDALAGVGAASQLIFIMLVAMIGVEVGGSVLVAQAVGAKNEAQASKAAKQTIFLGVLVAIPLSIISYTFSDQMIGFFGMDPAVEVLAVEYWEIVALSLGIATLVFVLSGILRGSGDTKTPMLATALAVIVNSVVAYLLIFGHLGLPELGVRGAAIGTTAGWTAEVILMFAVILLSDRAFSLSGKFDWLPQAESVRSIVSIGGPMTIEEISISFGFAVLTAVVAVLGTPALAAHRIVFNALSLAFLPGLGLAMAATALVGQSVGAKKPAEGQAAAKISAQFAALWMGVIGLVYFVLARQIMMIFSSDPQVIDIGTGAMRALAFSPAIWGLMLVFSGALRGTGDSRFPMIANSIDIWSGVILSFLIIQVLDLGLAAAWLSFAFIAPIPVVLMWRRMKGNPALNPDIQQPSLEEPFEDDVVSVSEVSEPAA